MSSNSKKTAAQKNATETSTETAAPVIAAPVIAAPVIAAPAKSSMVFKIGKKQLPTGKRGGGGKRGSKYTDGTMLKFATTSYASVEKSKGLLMHILEGNAMLVYPHTSGKYADHNNVVSEVSVAEGTQLFDNYEAALAARAIEFATKDGENFLGFINNAKLPDGYKTNKSQQYHGFLMADSAADIETAVKNLSAWNDIPGSELFRADKDLEFITDADGNIDATPLKVETVIAEAAKIQNTNVSNTNVEAAKNENASEEIEA